MPEPIVSFNKEPLKADLRELVSRTVEEMPNDLLDEEVDDLIGHHERKLTITSGEVTVRMPKSKGMPHYGDH